MSGHKRSKYFNTFKCLGSLTIDYAQRNILLFWKRGKILFNQIQITKQRLEAHNSNKYSYLSKVADQQSRDIPKVTRPFH